MFHLSFYFLGLHIFLYHFLKSTKQHSRCLISYSEISHLQKAAYAVRPVFHAKQLTPRDCRSVKRETDNKSIDFQWRLLKIASLQTGYTKV